jgi:hypothetical protein
MGGSMEAFLETARLRRSLSPSFFAFLADAITKER